MQEASVLVVWQRQGRNGCEGWEERCGTFVLCELNKQGSFLRKHARPRLDKGWGQWDFRFCGFGYFLDRFFGFCCKSLRFFGFGGHCGLRIFRFLASGFRFS